MYLPCNDELLFLGNGWIFSLYDSISNVCYFFFGILGVFLIHNSALHRLEKMSTAQFRATQNPVVSPWHTMLLYAWIIVIGCASTVYHSTLQPWSLCADFFAIKIFVDKIL